MMNPITKLRNWIRGTKGEEPTPLIVDESHRSYLWTLFLLIWPIPGFFVLLTWNPLEGQAAEWVGQDWVLYLIFMFMAEFPYPLYRVTKDQVHAKTDLVTYPLDRTTMADSGKKGTMTVGLSKKKEVTADNPASHMITLILGQRGGYRELLIKGDPTDGIIGYPEGTLLDFGHTKVINAHLHRMLIGDVPEPFQSAIKNKLPMKDYHFIDLGFEPIWLTIRPEDTGEMITAMEDTWNILDKIQADLNGKENGDYKDDFEKAQDNMAFLKKTLMNTEAGKPKFNAFWLLKEQQREIDDLKSQKKEGWFEKRAEDRRTEQPPRDET